MNTANLNQIQLNSYPGSGVKNKTYTTDARLVVVRSKTYTTDAVLQANFTRTYTTDAVLQGGSTKFYSTDAVLVTPYHDNGPWHRMVGNNTSLPIDQNSLSQWSTYSRPTIVANRPVVGYNKQTGKIEYWDPIAGAWKNYDGSAV